MAERRQSKDWHSMNQYKAPTVLGWYETTIKGYTLMQYRWWNGVQWSQPATRDYTSEQAAKVALHAAIFHLEQIEWTPIK